jgi:hypothetical protein
MIMPPELGPPTDLPTAWVIAIWAGFFLLPLIAVVVLAWGEPARRRYDAAPRVRQLGDDDG